MQKVVSALSYIPADDRDTWIKVGMAIKATYHDAGFDIWNTWSQSAESYNARVAQANWRSFRATKLSINTVFYLARQNGWVDDAPQQQLSPEELERRRREAEQRRIHEEQQTLRKNRIAARKALALWRTATPLRRDHPYFVRKRVDPVISLREISDREADKVLGYWPKSDDIPLVGRLVVVPIKVGDQLTSCEMIDENGRKAAIYGSARQAGYWAAQTLPEDDPTRVIAIGEGVATVLSAKLATGCVAVAAMNHYNLQAVAEFFRKRYAKAKILLLGDLLKKTGAPDDVAIEASQEAKVEVRFPRFDPSHSGLTDFNDMHVTYGLESVSQAINVLAG